MSDRYDITKSIVFRKTTDEFGGLSNMSRAFPLRVYGIRVATSEAMYQALRFPDYPEIQSLILNATKPKAAKLIARSHLDFNRPDWNDVRVAIMTWVLRMKFCQHSVTFGKLLEATGDRAIVEFSKRDAFWGASPIQVGVLEGQNVLGRLLMQMREDIRHGKQPQDFVADPQIANLKLMELPISGFQAARVGDPLPFVRPKDLIASGIPPGHHLGRLVERCRQAQLEGRLGSQADAISFAQSIWQGMCAAFSR